MILSDIYLIHYDTQSVIFFVKHFCKCHQIFIIEKEILWLSLAQGQYQEE